MTNAQLRRVHIALDQCGGRVKDAALLLGIPTTHLRELIEENPELKSYDEDCSAPTKADVVASPPLIPSDPSNALARADAFNRDQKKLRGNLAAVGVTDEVCDVVQGLVKLSFENFNMVRHIGCGSVATSLISLVVQQRELVDDIKAAKAAGDLDREAMLREDYSRVCNAINATYDRVLTAQRLEASIEAAKMAARNQDKNGKRRPAFTPLAMQVNGSVTVNAPQAQPEEPVSADTQERAA